MTALQGLREKLVLKERLELTEIKETRENLEPKEIKDAMALPALKAK